MRYKTKPIDYTGCNEIIAEYLKRGEAIFCNVNDSENNKFSGRKENVIGWSKAFHYITDGGDFYNAEPIQTKQRVKKASEIVKWLEDNEWNYYESTNNSYWFTHKYSMSDCKFFTTMLKYCGEEKPDVFSWHEEWLEEISHDLSNVKNS